MVANLVTHRGARLVSYGDLDMIPAPPPANAAPTGRSARIVQPHLQPRHVQDIGQPTEDSLPNGLTPLWFAFTDVDLSVCCERLLSVSASGIAAVATRNAPSSLLEGAVLLLR